MSVTLNQVRAYLTQDEVNYEAARKLGPDAVPLLLDLVRGGDLNLASKAAYLASLIPAEASIGVLEEAARSPEVPVRVAAAAGMRHLSEHGAERVLAVVKADPDVGVRKVALHSAAAFRGAGVVGAVEEMARHEKEPFLQELAKKTRLQLK